MRKIRLGVIGLSDGNGHPYSWSAIFNGYDMQAMEACGFPAILTYLAKQNFPADAIAEASVTHVWTQDRDLSEHVARAAKIGCVVDKMTDMIGQIDGVLLARDDAERHYEFAAPFLEAGLPIYIDKPISLSISDLDRLYRLQNYPGQIFTCSALKYANELRVSGEGLARLGELRRIHAITPNDWDRYAVHIIEPLLGLIGDHGKVTDLCRVPAKEGASTLFVSWQSGLRAQVSAVGHEVVAPISLRLMGTNGWVDLTFSDSFHAFKAALYDFVLGVLHGDVRTDPEFVRRTVFLIEAGRRE